MTIVKDTNGKVFGGYTDVNFGLDLYNKKVKKNSFLFSYINGKYQKFKCISYLEDSFFSNSAAS